MPAFKALCSDNKYRATSNYRRPMVNVETEMKSSVRVQGVSVAGTSKKAKGIWFFFADPTGKNYEELPTTQLHLDHYEHQLSLPEVPSPTKPVDALADFDLDAFNASLNKSE